MVLNVTPRMRADERVCPPFLDAMAHAVVYGIARHREHK
jgi:hypothetical protein